MDELQKDVLIGSLLGDGNLHTNNGQTWRLRMLHSDKQEDYLNHKYTVFQSFCKSGPIKQSVFDKRTQKSYTRFYFNTVYTDVFRFYGQSFYKPQSPVDSKVELAKNESNLVFSDKSKLIIFKKVVPKNIHRFLTARALAYWFMDDGSLKWKTQTQSLVLCTESFVPSDVQVLKLALERNFNLKVSLQKKKINSEQFRLYISSKSYLQFKSFVNPYMHSSMLYKLPY